MKCMHCQGELERGAAPLHVDRKGCHILLDAVPSWVCSQCGEPFFDEREVDAIQDLVATIEERAGAIALSA